jgi:type IV pilus assembly protein PilA
MFKQLKKLQKDNQGFTLVELMIVVAIIGILAAIAIPQFAQYRIRGFNASAQSDVRNLSTAEATFYADWQVYGNSQAALADATTGSIGVLLTGPSSATTLIAAVVDGVDQSMPIGLGNLVSAVANTNALVVGPPIVAGNTTVTAGAKHQNGNTIFAIDTDTTIIYKNATALAVGTLLGAGITNLPTATVGDDFGTVANWVAQ